ncbi:MAG: hypothetical protein HY248_03885, partial [Fimbriimonas ginsengisoli]|nr:hypothetical protein [Fimbriimonas ginsengisoli]
LIVRTALSFAMRFAGAPSEGLEGAPGHEATASTGFDRSGKGVVTLVLDGQQVQVLASLESDELKRGVRVGKGDRVILTSVDAARNRCSVSKELGE